MKHSFSLLALVAATTLAEPVAAQDMSSFLNPNALAANLGLHAPAPATILVPQSQVRVLPAPVIISEAPTLRLVDPAARLGEVAELMEEMADAAPYGSNIAVLRQSPSPRPTWFQRLFGL